MGKTGIGILAATVGVLLTLAFAGPAGAQVAPGACYPPPCAASAPGSPVLQAASDGSATIGLPRAAQGSSATPFVVVGLLMVATSFTTIVMSRLNALGRRARLVLAPAAGPPDIVLREPDASVR